MIELLLIVLSGLVLVPVLVLSVQVAKALTVPADLSDEVFEKSTKIAVLIPAHNEESVISETIKALKSQLNSGDQLLLVADNCTDNTASIARDQGAEVLERVDPENRGKGYALSFGINHLKDSGNTPEVVIVIDADCIVEKILPE